MSENTLTILIIGSVMLATFNAVRAAYWKAKYIELNSQFDNTGYIEEIRFLRQLINPEAADKAIDE